MSVALELQEKAVRRGMLLMLVAVSLLPLMDAMAKELAQRYPVMQVTWGRYVFTLLWILPGLLLRYRDRLLPVPQPWLQLVRGLAQVGATFLFFLTLTFLPLADTVALAFLYPLIVTALSPFVLGERVGWRRYVAVVPWASSVPWSSSAPVSAFSSRPQSSGSASASFLRSTSC